MATNNNKNLELDMTQRTLIALYRESLKSQKIGANKLRSFSIILGDETDLADGTLNDNALEREKQNFEILKNEAIVSKFTGPFWEYEYPDINPDFSDYYCYITGEFYPDKVIKCLEKIWKPKQKLSEEIVVSYRKLTELVQTYFSKPILGNIQIAEEFNRKSNELYRALSNRIAELFQVLDTSLINTDDGFLFFTGAYIPFTSLFSAQKELNKKRMDIKSAIANMDDFYGKLVDIENSFKLETYRKQELKLKLVVNHINQLKNTTEQAINISKEKIVNYSRENKTAEKYEVSIKDREIWINNTYLISKPHAVGSNLEFFIYLFENQNKHIKKNELPENIKNEIKGKRFSKILNALGFKGEILKAFFPKRGKIEILFNQVISNDDLKSRGIKENIFLKELDLAHTKNSSK